MFFSDLLQMVTWFVMVTLQMCNNLYRAITSLTLEIKTQILLLGSIVGAQYFACFPQSYDSVSCV